MSSFLDLMLRPFVACLILTGMHVYLGLHVIEREVIFVDLALAQTAALGATIGLLFGWELHSTAGYFCALSFTIVGSGILAITRLKKPIVPQEALIGIVYVVSAAAAVLVLSRAPTGDEDLKALLVGHLLFVDWSEIFKIFVLYSTIGAVHYVARKPLLAISQDPQEAYRQNMRVRLWDFLFYATFGVIVTSSTDLAGVLLVFAFLVVPSVCGVLLGERIRSRLIVGWSCGLLTSMAGVCASYFFDLPTGAAVVCAFGVCLLACYFLRAALGYRGGNA